jgi:nucleotide-binding universal stress UspA family protein
VSIRHIVVATDFSHDANHALTVATDLARSLSVKLTVIHVVQMPTYAFLGGGVYVPSPELVADITSEAKRWLAAAKERLTGIDLETVCLEGDPATMILRWAEEHAADLIVVGTHGRRGLRRLLLGSVAEQVVRGAHCPVTTVRAEP